tara:strand:- start:5928 stop:6680 length:753 start_codon:yes stop_codon:yes gene_type:complete
MQKQYKKNVCNNCGITGHLFYKCKKPIMSFGIICYRHHPVSHEIEYLMVRRKDTLGYVDFLRGKYNQHNEFHLKNIIQEMTIHEKECIKKCIYQDLWNKLWIKTNEKCEKKNIDKFNFIKEYKMNLFEDQGWDEPEWGFPKGRRNNKENDFDCSIREFEEETGYNASDLTMIKNIGFFEETFTGSNLKSYRHKYYLCKAEYEKTKNEDKFQKSEIGDLKWFTYEECLKRIRLYNFEKRKMLIKINNIINK